MVILYSPIVVTTFMLCFLYSSEYICFVVLYFLYFQVVRKSSVNFIKRTNNDLEITNLRYYVTPVQDDKMAVRMLSSRSREDVSDDCVTYL